MAPVEEDKARMQNIEEVTSSDSLPRQPTTSGGKVKAHFRKWWWVHLILFLIGTIVIAVILCYVAFPKIAQHGINQSELTVNSLILSNPTPNSFHLSQNSTITNNSPYHPQLDAFNASLSLQGTNTPYAYVELPHLHATQSGTNLIDQDVSITDLAAFTAYNIAVLNQESVQINVNGSTTLHEMKFPDAKVAYNTTTTMKGFNKFSGFNVSSIKAIIPPDADGTNMVGEVYFPNPSVLTLHMGNVTFGNFLPATPYSSPYFLGNSTLENLVLVPGNNTIPMRSVINQTVLLDAIGLVYKDGILPVDIVGATSVYNGQHLPYFEAALQSLTQHVKLDAGAALKAATGGGGARRRRQKRD